MWNAPLQFALGHSMRIFPSNSLYTVIPKNGCSSLRYSVAVANGCVAGPENLNWIHQNNRTFEPRSRIRLSQRLCFRRAALPVSASAQRLL